jgi:hypothetical protein
VAGHDNWIMPSSMIDIMSETVPKKQNNNKRTANRKSALSVPSMITGTCTNREKNVRDNSDDDSCSSSSTGILEQNSSNKRRKISSLITTTSKKRAATLYDLEQEANKLFDDDSCNSNDSTKRNSNKAGKTNSTLGDRNNIIIPTNRTTKAIPGKNAINSNSSYDNWQNEYNDNSFDDVEISIQDLFHRIGIIY